MFTSFLLSVAANGAYGTVVALVKTLIPEKANEIDRAVLDAVDEAARKLFETYGDQLGEPNESFLAQQANLTKILESTFPGSNALVPEAIDPVGASGAEASQEVVKFFVDSLRVELRNNRLTGHVIATQDREQRAEGRHDEMMGSILELTSTVNSQARTIEQQASELSALRATIDERLPEPEAREVAAQLKNELEDAITALNSRNLRRAGEILDTIEVTLDDYRREDPDGEGALVPIRQIVLAVRAEVASELFDQATVERLVIALKESGVPTAESARAVGFAAALAEDREWLSLVLEELPDDDERRPWFEAISVWLDVDDEGCYNAAGVLDLVDEETDQADLIILRAQAAMYSMDESRAEEADHLLDRLSCLDPEAEELVATAPLITAFRTFNLLEEIVKTQVGGVDLSELIVKVKRRFRAAIRHAESIEDQYPHALASALVGLALCHKYLEEIKQVDELDQRIREVRAKHSTALATVAVPRDDATDPSVINALQDGGAVTPSELTFLKGRVALEKGNTSRAKNQFFAALEMATTPPEASRVLAYLIDFVAPDDPAGFMRFVEEEVEGGHYSSLLGQDEVDRARVFGLYRRDGIDVALEVSEGLVAARSGRLALLRDRYFLLKVKRGEEERSDGANLPTVLALMEGCADMMYNLLPAPAFKLYRAQALARLGQRDYARQLWAEGESEFARAERDAD